DLAKAEDLVNDIFKEEIAKAKDAEARTKLAAYLLQQGDESSEDPAARYVLYREANRLAILAGNAPLSMSAIDKLTKRFVVDGLPMKAAALMELTKYVDTKEPSKHLTELALEMIAEALEADDYDAAVELGKAATLAAKKALDVNLVTAIQKRNAE